LERDHKTDEEAEFYAGPLVREWNTAQARATEREYPGGQATTSLSERMLSASEFKNSLGRLNYQASRLTNTPEREEELRYFFSPEWS